MSNVRHTSASGGIVLTRSAGERWAAGVLGLILTLFTGILWVTGPAIGEPDSQGIRKPYLDFVIYQWLAAMFVLGVLFLIWGIAAPRWIEKRFMRGLFKLQFALCLFFPPTLIVWAIVVFLFWLGSSRREKAERALNEAMAEAED